jgi:hypothetical protein
MPVMINFLRVAKIFVVLAYRRLSLTYNFATKNDFDYFQKSLFWGKNLIQCKSIFILLRALVLIFESFQTTSILS